MSNRHGGGELSASRVSKPALRLFDGLPRIRVRDRSTALYWAAVACLVAAASALWLVRSGSSSLFTDEAVSWLEGRSRLQQLVAFNREDELNPLGYPLLLHEWLRLGLGSSEWWLRLPSVLAAIALMVGLVWLALLVAGRMVAFVAVLLGAVSPFMFDYAQMARAYMFVMLAVTIAVASVLQAERSERSQWRWLTLSAMAAAAAQCLHYSAWCVLLPLGFYVATRGAFSIRARFAWTSAVAVAGLAWTPLLVEQMNAGHTEVLTTLGNLTPGHLGDVFGDAFSGRIWQPPQRSLPGAGIVVAAALVCLATRRRQLFLIGALAIAAPVALLLATLVGHPSLVIRYAGVSVPFMLVSLAVAVVMLPTPSATAVLVGVLVLSLWNLRAADQPTSQYKNYRGGLTFVATHYRPGDVVVALGTQLTVFDLDYYVPRILPHVHVVELPPAPPQVILSTVSLRAATRTHKTIWFINSSFPDTPTPHPSGYVLTAHHVFVDIPWLTVARFSDPAPPRAPSP
jgi:mannosyltransferase